MALHNFKLLTESEVIIGISQTETLMYVKAKVCNLAIEVI